MDSMNVTVNDSEAPVSDAGPDLSVKVGEVLKLNGSESSDNIGITNYTWSFIHDGNDVVLYGIDPTFAFRRSGNYNFGSGTREDPSSPARYNWDL